MADHHRTNTLACAYSHKQLNIQTHSLIFMRPFSICMSVGTVNSKPVIVVPNIIAYGTRCGLPSAIEKKPVIRSPWHAVSNRFVRTHKPPNTRIHKHEPSSVGGFSWYWTHSSPFWSSGESQWIQFVLKKIYLRWRLKKCN